MNEETSWVVNEIAFDLHGRLTIDAIPAYGNRKRWEGKMAFYLNDIQHGELSRLIAERKDQEHMKVVALSEMREFIEDFKIKYHEKKRLLAEKLTLENDDVPRPIWYSIEDEAEPVMFSSN